MNRTILVLVSVVLSLSSCTDVDRLLLQQDVEFIRSAVVENYPYLQVHRHRDHFDWTEKFDLLRSHPSIAYDGNNRIEYLSQFLKGLNGHAHLVDAQSFPYYVAGYLGILKTHPEYGPWAEVLTKPSVLAAYGQTIPSILRQPKKPHSPSEKHHFEKKASGDVLYLKVPTFDGALEPVEGPKIVEFLRSSSRPSSLIIFDVRGNGGGSDLFWINSIVKPLLTAPLKHQSTILYKGGPLSMPFLNAKKVALEDLRSAGPSFLFNGEKDDFRYFSLESETIEPSGDAIAYRKLVVLMDRQNFSSSESFVAFCKATKFATTVGRNSGGDGIGFDPILVELPFSHLIVALPICAALNPDGMLNYAYGTTPEVLLEKNEDPLDYVVSHRGEF